MDPVDSDSAVDELWKVICVASKPLKPVWDRHE